MDQIKKKLASLKNERDDANERADTAKEAEKAALAQVNAVSFPTNSQLSPVPRLDCM